MRSFKLVLCIILLFPVNQLLSQDSYGASLLLVRDATGGYYAFPWAGGMNSCQFGSVDLDMDGIKDLLVFDRTGDRVMPFLNEGLPGQASYVYVPHYAARFPPLRDWVILTDYDMDGREDIFTYSPGYAGMIVYRNVSEGELEFERVVYPYLTSFQGGGFVNILVTYVDYPGIVDVDGDGDLDILTFYGLGSFVEMHKNLSFEKYGHYDSLDFEKTTYCWGYFAESEESNELTLDTCIGWSHDPEDGKVLPHTGSTFLLLDLDGNGVLDLLLGDVDYPNLVALHNEGTADSAHMGAFEQFFPSYDRSVFLYSLPVAAFIDVDNDGTRDLLVSPFDPNPALCANKFSSWLYYNTGTNEVPDFTFERDDFLQGEMIDVGAGSYPCMADYNADGLMDLFIGNYGYYDSSWLDQNLILHTEHTGKIALYQDIGTEGHPEFTFITDDLAGLSTLEKKGLVPSFADLDDDGDMDMIFGYEDGKIALYENIAGAGQQMEFQQVTLNFENIDAGDYSTPQLFDLDKDGTIDLIIGERKGNINFYKGSPGDQWMEFTLVTDSLGKINVTDPNLYLDGYSVPHFFRDKSGNTLLLVGSRQGEIYFYTGIDNNLSGSFSISDTLGEYLGLPGLKTDRGYLTSAMVRDLDGDGTPEMLAGNFSGGLEYLSMAAPPQVSGTGEGNVAGEGFRLFPNPAQRQVSVVLNSDCDGYLDRIRLMDIRGNVVLDEAPSGVRGATLDISGISSGMYIISITVSSLNNTKTVIYRKLTIN